MTTTDKIKKVTKEIEFRLTDEEISEKGKLAGSKSASLRELEADFDRTKKSYKAKIETLRGEIDSLLRVIDDGKENRDAECEEVHDFATNRVVTMHLGSQIDERAMEMHERQESLFPKADSADDRAKKKRKKKGEQGDLELIGDTELDRAAAGLSGATMLDAETEIQKNIDEANKVTLEQEQPIREQVSDEFKQAAKVVRGW